MAEKSYIAKYREGLIESIKVAGQMLIDNAEELAGKVDNMSHFDISIDFDQEKTGSIPELTITKSFFPPEKEVYSLMDIYRNGKPERHNTDIAKLELELSELRSKAAKAQYKPKECEIRGE